MFCLHLQSELHNQKTKMKELFWRIIEFPSFRLIIRPKENFNQLPNVFKVLQ